MELELNFGGLSKRDFDQLFSFQDYETTTGHITFYYKEPRTQIITRLKGGRFLAEDSGINLEFSRRFKSGLRIGAFFSELIFLMPNLAKVVLIKDSFSLFLSNLSLMNIPRGHQDLV